MAQSRQGIVTWNIVCSWNSRLFYPDITRVEPRVEASYKKIIGIYLLENNLYIIMYTYRLTQKTSTRAMLVYEVTNISEILSYIKIMYL